MSIVAKINRAEWDELKARYPDCTEHDITHASLYSDPDFRRMFLDKVAEDRRRRAALPCVSPEAEVVETVPPLPALATPADDRPTLVATPVVTEAQAILMGRIRHIQRWGFSADNSEIDDDRQRDWWRTNRARCVAYLYSFGGVLAGYGALLQRHDGTWVSSCAVLPGHEGRKYGGRILSHLVQSVGHVVYARALISNPAACALHNDREWEMVAEDGECRHYRTRPKVRVEHGVSQFDYSEPEAEPPCGWWMGAPVQAGEANGTTSTTGSSFPASGEILP